MVPNDAYTYDTINLQNLNVGYTVPLYSKVAGKVNVNLTGTSNCWILGTGVDSTDQSSNSGECGSNGGYWVDGGLTNYQIDSQLGQVTLWGTNTGMDQNGNQSYTYAQYQDTTLNVGFYLNSSLNPYGHVAIGIGNQIPMGLDPASFPRFLGTAALRGALGLFNSPAAAFNAASTTSVRGAVNPQTSNGLAEPTIIPIPITGMQAIMIENAIVESSINPGNYTIFGTNGCDCGIWVQQIMGTAGIYSGPPAAIPQDLMRQLLSIY